MAVRLRLRLRLAEDHGPGRAFRTSMQALRASVQGPASGRSLADTWRLRDANGAGQPDHQHDNAAVSYESRFCKTGVYYNPSCNDADPGEPPYLATCAARAGKTAYLRWIINPFAATSPREQLFWAWNASKAPNWSGYCHRGSHSNPLIQVVDANGAFRGSVGVEMQRSSATEPKSGGGYQEATHSYRETDYRVWRWIQSGYEEVP